MPKNESEAQQELNVVLQEKKRLEKHISEAQKRILANEKRLKENAPTTQTYQRAFDEWSALQTHVGEIHAQLASLDQVLQDLKEHLYSDSPS